ncbi:xanthine dehydrogenase family protein molybdopterin-binding subunit [Sphingomonas sp. NFR15]|uniref:xanthine dehydrogenase family protein molybdopterin-binding subunit n=1 Tax=Sphingomonas sp. NFR15 TaxID=1566282 RepID=UPI000B874AD0|nr:molybdopterin cofactor-binding domain-containing protein [Sphingomonas sp. NFR15]
MAARGEGSNVSRRGLLVGGGAGVGLLVAWALWPRGYAPNLPLAKGETLFNAWLKIGEDGTVTVAVPQAEHGQGVYTALPQILADELGADWRTVAVQPALLNPLYANPRAADTLFTGVFDAVPPPLREAHARRGALLLTAGSTSVRMFEAPLRAAGAAARVLLCQAAAKRWGVDWRACATEAGFVTHGKRRLRFAELAAAAPGGTLPDPLPLRADDTNRLTGQSLPRLDAPAKIDGSANFAGDIRLPDMVFAAIRQAPLGDARLLSVDRAAAAKVRGMLSVVTNDGWVAAVASNGWAADRALDALAPRFTIRGTPINSDSIDAALDAALAGDGTRIWAQGDLAPVFKGARLVTAEYRAGLAVHAAIETMTATARLEDGRLELWLPTQAPGLARAAAAAALGIAEAAVTVYPMLIGGSFGANLDHRAAQQAAVLARVLKRPVQLTWSRREDLQHDRYRPPALARMAARLGANGQILGWQARIAAPATGRELAARLLDTDAAARAALALPATGDRYAVAGARPFYRIPAYAIDHHPADIGVPTGHWRSGAHSYTAFFTECFIDELAHVAGTEALSFRIAMLGGDARLARCLSTAAALGGWEGGVPGSGQGIACHSFRGSHIAVLAEAHIDDDRTVAVDRIVAAVDCGRQINPDLVRQQIEGGLIFGMAAAIGGATGFSENRADVRTLRDLGLPRLADTPDITVELISSEADPGGVSELAVPAVAPAIANALQTSTGYRLRSLPLTVGNS